MAGKSEISPELQALIDKVTGKRPRAVIDHILEHGQVTTQELKDLYGYSHAPRAARDVREKGVPLKTTMVSDGNGGRMAAYTFGDPSKIINGRLAGRVVFSKEFKTALVDEHGGKCAVCQEGYGERYLQVDHRVPYEVAGDEALGERNVKKYMPLCGSCNRAKSWSCEHCDNWLHAKDESFCDGCYWAHPEGYEHVAGTEERRVVIVWRGEDIVFYDELVQKADGLPLEEYLKLP